MNTNVKNAAIGLLLLGATGGIVTGIGYGIKQGSKITVTDPQEAEKAIKQESDYSKTIFYAERNVNIEQNVKQLKPEITDFNTLSTSILEYTQMYNKVLAQLDSLNKAGNTDANKIMEIVSKLNEKSEEITKSFENFQTDDPGVADAVENCKKQFTAYQTNMTPLLNKYIPAE